MVLLSFGFFAWCAAVWLLIKLSSGGRSYSRYRPDVENEGGPDFIWRGHEAEDAYREKHWGSRRALRQAEADLRESEIRADERAKCERPPSMRRRF